jgi:hypothetical protein
MGEHGDVGAYIVLQAMYALRRLLVCRITRKVVRARRNFQR